MKLIDQLPPRLAQIKEIADFQEAVQPFIDDIDVKCEQILKNRNPLYADLEGIQVWEEWLNIIPDPAKTLEQRRIDIISKLNERLPFTLVQLHRMLAGIVGWDNFEITTYPGEPKIMISYDQTVKNVGSSIFNLLQRIIPAHVLWILKSYFNTGEAKTNVSAFMYFGQELTINPYEEHEFETETQKIYASAHLSMEIDKWQ